MTCNTAVKDGLLERNPCQIVGAMNPKPKKKVKIPTTFELHTIADKLRADERTSPFKALVLLAGWCGLRFGEVTELRRKDFDSDCTVVKISRAVTHRADPNTPGADRCRIDTTKNGEERTVTIRRIFATTLNRIWRSSFQPVRKLGYLFPFAAAVTFMTGCSTTTPKPVVDRRAGMTRRRHSELALTPSPC